MPKRLGTAAARITLLSALIGSASACQASPQGGGQPVALQNDAALSAALTAIAHRFVEQSVREESLHLRTQDDLVRFWRRFDAAAPPAVDFTRYDVVLVLMGTRPSGGYAVKIVSAAASGPQTTIDALFCSPPPGAMNTAEVTSPFDARLIAKRDQPLAFSRHQGTTGEGDCR